MLVWIGARILLEFGYFVAPFATYYAVFAFAGHTANQLFPVLLVKKKGQAFVFLLCTPFCLTDTRERIYSGDHFGALLTSSSHSQHENSSNRRLLLYGSSGESTI